MGNLKISQKQQRFCDEYLVDLNATRAYVAAGYSENGAAVSACKLLKIPKIRDYIKVSQDKMAERTQLNGDKVVRELAAIVWGEDHGKRSDARTPDRLKALELLGRHFGIFAIDHRQANPYQHLNDGELMQKIDELEKKLKVHRRVQTAPGSAEG